MPPKVWGAGSGPQTTVYSTGTNWTGDTKPGPGDDVILNSVDVTDCILDEPTAALNSWTVDFDGGDVGDYTGTLNFNGNNVNVTGGGGMTFGGSGAVDCSASTITCSGNFNNETQGTWVAGTSTLVMDGEGKTLRGDSNRDLENLRITGTVSASSANRLDVNGVVDVQVGAILTLTSIMNASGVNNKIDGTIIINGAGDFRLTKAATLTGTVDGTGTLQLGQGTVLSGTLGTISVANIRMNQNVTIIPGTWGGGSSSIDYQNESPSEDKTLTLSAGAYIFAGDVSWEAEKIGRTTTVNASAATSIEFQGDWTFLETGTLEFIPPAVTILDSTTTYTDNSDITQNIGDVEVSGDLTLASDMDCDLFTGLAGGSLNMSSATHMLDASDDMDWEIDFVIHAGSGILTGAVIRTNGDFTADNQDIVEDGGTWELQVMGGGSAVASGAGSVKNCDARGDGGSGGTTIQALAWTPEGGNLNWNFGAVGSPSPRSHLYGPLVGSLGGPI